MNRFDCIIFDLDGTLWDSSGSILNSWNETISRYGEVREKLTIDDMKGIMGLVIEDVALKLFPYLDEDKRSEVTGQCCINECKYLGEHGAVLYDGLEYTLKILADKYKLFIVSNCECGYIESFYKYHKLDKYFIDFENSGRTGLCKGENIKLIMKRNNLKRAVYVGDTEGDLKASKIADIPFIYAGYGFGDVKEYDYSIDSIDELLKLL